VIASQAVGSACSLEFDNFTCSRVTAPIGPVVTDFRGYAPATTGFSAGTTPNINVIWRRVGDSVHIIGTFVAGGTGIGVSGDMEIFLPSGMSIDTTKIGTGIAVGAAEIHNAGNYRYSGSVVLASSTSFKISARANAATGGNLMGTAIPEAGWWNITGDQFSFEMMAPISGWSSSVQMSNDTDTRVVAAAVASGAAVGVTNNTIQLPFGATTLDTHAGVGVNQYTIPVSGFYRISATARTQFSISDATFNHSLNIYKNASVSVTDAVQGDGKNNAGLYWLGTFVDGIVQCVAGDVITIRFTTNYTGTATTGLQYCSINRLSGPSVIAASETVALVRKSSSGQTINNGIGAYVDLPIADIDTHNGWVAASGSYNAATGTWSVQNPGYRVPVSGKYLVSGTVGYLQDVFNGSIASTNLLKNGSSFATGVSSSSASSAQYITSATAMVNCVAGDLISLNTFQSTGGTRTLQTYGSERTYLSIVRVGQ
jgi:hypothetical protein